MTQGAEDMETMPQNAATSNEDVLPVTNTAYPNNNTAGMQTEKPEEEPQEEEPALRIEDIGQQTEETGDAAEEEPEPEPDTRKDNPVFGYIVMAALAGGAIFIYTFLKKRKRKGEDFIDEDEDEAFEDEEDYGEDENDDGQDDFFDDDGSNNEDIGDDGESGSYGDDSEAYRDDTHGADGIKDGLAEGNPDEEDGYLDDDMPDDFEDDLEFLDFDIDDAVGDAIRDEERNVIENEPDKQATGTDADPEQKTPLKTEVNANE